MGLATAHAAADAGAAVTIASSNAGRLGAALAGSPAGCDGVVADSRRESDIAAPFDHVGELDHVVYTAGDPYTAAGPAGQRAFRDISLDEARRQQDVRFWGAVAAAKHAVARIRPGGSIVLTSGTIGVRPTPGSAPAAAGAGAIEGPPRRTST